MFHLNRQSPTDFRSVVSRLKTLREIIKMRMIKVVKLIFVMPATNAVSERSFGALRRLKTWLWTTTSLNWCTLLHIHKERTDSSPMTSVLNEFIGHCETRVAFGLNS